MKESTQQSSGKRRVVVRNYSPEDFGACRELWNELTQWHRQIYGDQSIGGTDPGRQFDKHLEQVGPENIWVAVSDGEIVGLAGLIRSDRSRGEVEPVVVKEGCRGKGVGSRLLNTIVELAKREGLRELTVRPVARNEEAIVFFHEKGFDTLGHMELIMDLRTPERWKKGPKMCSRTFRF